MEVRLIVSDACHFFAGNIKQIAALCLPVLIAVSIFDNLILNPYQALQESGNAIILSWAVNLLARPIYMAALILLMAKRAENQRPGNSELMMAALQRYGTLLMLSLIAMALIWSGIMLLVIPGIWASVRLSFAKYYLVLEGLHPREAIIKSFHATRKHFWLILTLLALFALPILILTVSISNLLPVLGQNRVLLALADTAITFLALFIDVVLFRVFMGVVREQASPQPES